MKTRLSSFVAGSLLVAGCSGDPSVSPSESARPATAANTDSGAVPSPRVLPDAGITDSAVVEAGANAPAPFGCVSKVSAGHHVFACGGLTYDVEITAACAAGGCGLVLDVHGLTMSANQEDRSTKLRAVGAPKGYVIVQPTAAAGVIGPSWNPGVDDDKVWAVLEDVRRALRIDEHRIHVTGFSQGGAMSWRMLCEHADVIASAAPIAAADGKNLDGNVPPFRIDCAFDATQAPSRPMSILQMHGKKDGLVPFDKAKLQRDAVLAWLGPVATLEVASDSHFTHTRFTSVAKGVVLEFIEHDYAVEPPLVPLPIKVAGHCFPGGTDLRAGAATASLVFSCAPPNAFVWADVVMEFFAAHPRP